MFADSIIASHHVFADFFDLMISSVIDLTQAHAALRLRLLLTHSLESSKTKCSGDLSLDPGSERSPAACEQEHRRHDRGGASGEEGVSVREGGAGKGRRRQQHTASQSRQGAGGPSPLHGRPERAEYL